LIGPPAPQFFPKARAPISVHSPVGWASHVGNRCRFDGTLQTSETVWPRGGQGNLAGPFGPSGPARYRDVFLPVCKRALRAKQVKKNVLPDLGKRPFSQFYRENCRSERGQPRINAKNAVPGRIFLKRDGFAQAGTGPAGGRGLPITIKSQKSLFVVLG